jgi:hypothetical protein
METDLSNTIEVKTHELELEIEKNKKLADEFKFSSEKIEKLKHQIEKLKEYTNESQSITN